MRSLSQAVCVALAEAATLTAELMRLGLPFAVEPVLSLRDLPETDREVVLHYSATDKAELVETAERLGIILYACPGPRTVQGIEGAHHVAA